MAQSLRWPKNHVRQKNSKSARIAPLGDWFGSAEPCDREFRRIIQQFAKASVRQSGWALAYWRDVRPRCRSDSDAYRRLANRWLGIIWRMWQDGKAYDESYHIQQRAQRRRPRS